MSNIENFMIGPNDLPNSKPLHGESNATIFGTTRGHTGSQNLFFFLMDTI